VINGVVRKKNMRQLYENFLLFCNKKLISFMVEKSENEEVTVGNSAQTLLTALPVGVLVFDSDFLITYFNPWFTAANIFPKTESAAAKKLNILTGKIPFFEEIQSEIKKLSTKHSFEKSVQSQKSDNEKNPSLLVKGTALFDGNNFAGGILLVEEIQESESQATAVSELHSEDYQNIFKQLDSLFLITDHEGTVQLLFGGLLKTIFKKQKTFTQRLLEDLFEGEARQQVKELFAEASGKKKKINSVIRSAVNEEQYLLDLQLCPVATAKKGVQFYCVFLSDISSLKEEQNLLQQQIDELWFYEMIIEKTTDALLVLNQNGEIISWNKAAEALTGYTKSEVYNKPLGKVFLSFGNDNLENVFSYLNTNDRYQAETTLLTKQKQKKEVEVTFFISSKDSGNNYIVLCADVTQKKEFERSLRVSEERFRSLVQNATDLICNINEQGKILYANPAFLNKLGLTQQELSEKKLQDLFDTTSPQKRFSLKQVVQGKMPSAELTLVSKEGVAVEVLCDFSVAFDSQNKIKHIGAILSDITAEKAFQQELLLMRAIFEASNDGIAVESDNAFIIVNNSFAKIFGYETGEELLQTEPMTLVDKRDYARVKSYSEARAQREPSPNHYEFLGKKKDGSDAYVEVSVTDFAFSENHFFVVVARDITERKKVEQAIKESEEHYRTITESLDDSLWTAERSAQNMRFTFFTSSIEKITGYPPSEFLNDTKYLFKITFPDDFKIVKVKLRKFINNYYKNSEELVFRIIHKQGHLVWIKNKITVTRNKQGTVQKMFGLVSDISLQKKAEEEVQRSADNLKKLNDTKDRFISIISHDLRTPFSSILGFTDILLNDDDISPDESKQYIGFIQESAQSMLSLVNSLLDWTRLQTGRIRFEPGKIDLFEQVKKAFDALAGFALTKNITLKNEIAQEVYVFADKNLLAQVFQNLLSNALKFTPSGGTISINIAQSDVPRFIEVSVTDTGMGIAKENLPKIFDVDAKYTSEGTAGEKGTGLGLSLVREIVEKHGGKIWAESNVGKGTTFKFIIPKASATILLVDDTKTDRILYSKILKSFVPDYDILVAGNGEEAWKIISETSLALVISDHGMTKMNGIELVKKVNASQLKGKPQIIILSGDVGKPETLAYNDLGVDYVFQKPVNLAQLKEAIEKSMRKIFI